MEGNEMPQCMQRTGGKHCEKCGEYSLPSDLAFKPVHLFLWFPSSSPLIPPCHIHIGHWWGLTAIKFSLYIIFADILNIENPVNWGLHNREKHSWGLTETWLEADWYLLTFTLAGIFSVFLLANRYNVYFNSDDYVNNFSFGT